MIIGLSYFPTRFSQPVNNILRRTLTLFSVLFFQENCISYVIKHAKGLRKFGLLAIVYPSK